MRKSKSDLPLIIFDQRVPDTVRFTEDQAGPLTEQNEDARTQARELPNLEDILQHLLMGLQRITIALKHRLSEVVSTIWGDLQIPWFKLIVLGIIAYALLVKDMQFNIALQAPAGGGIGLLPASGGEDGGSALNMAYQGDLTPASVASLKEEKARAFIKRYAPVAVAEMKKYGIPASIKMGQALIESQAGQSRLALQSNNHFGIKCKAKCRGCTCRNYADDGAFDMFRVFENPWESWREHSELLQIERYRGLKQHAQKLIDVIEKYQLHQLDQH